MNKLKQTKGITLIALIITIIVLLILAGVTLAMVMGENGIIRKAQMAKERTNASQEEEKEQLEEIEEQVETLGRAGSANSNYSTDEQVIGKWIDGETLYQKTFVKENGLVNGQWHEIGSFSTDISINVHSINGTIHHKSGALAAAINSNSCIPNDTNLLTLFDEITNKVNMYVWSNANYAWDYATVTVQYTQMPKSDN